MEQQSLSPEVLNQGFPSFDFIVHHKNLVTDFFGDNRHWYKKLLGGNTNRSYSVAVHKEGLEVRPPQTTVWLHDEQALMIDQENPPLNPLLINEGRAEQIEKFFIEQKDARNDFVNYSNKEKVN